jgi:hypothetical protein
VVFSAVTFRHGQRGLGIGSLPRDLQSRLTVTDFDANLCLVNT